MVQARVPVLQAHVRQFIMARYGQGSHIIHVSMKSFLGRLLNLSAEKVGYRHVVPTVPKLDESKLIILHLPDALKYCYVHPDDLLTLARLFQDIFNETLDECIQTNQALRISDYDAVDIFMDRYGITEDMVASDTLRKRYRDHQYKMRLRVERMMYGDDAPAGNVKGITAPPVKRAA